MPTELRVPAAYLEGRDDPDTVWRAIERAYSFVDSSSEPDVLHAQLHHLTRGQRGLLAVHWCLAETLNGGFDQFLSNASGRFAEEASEGFRLIGVPEAATLLDEAQKIFVSRPPPPGYDDPELDEAADAEQFDAYRDRYAPLEKRFYALIDSHLYPQAAAFVRNHPEEFTS